MMSMQSVFAAGETAAVTFTKTEPAVTVCSYKDVNRIKWNKIDGAVKYNVYRSDKEKGKYTLIGSSKTSRYDDADSESGAIYYYKVRAYNKNKSHTQFSSPVRFQTIFRVYIACGHGTNEKGYWDPGTTYNGMQEAKLMLPITEDFVAYMRKSGVYVYTDADGGNKLNRNKCIRKANKKKISAYISIHCDYQYAPSGTMPLYNSREDKKLAKALNKGVHRTVKIKNRGLCKRPELQELYKTKAVSCTFETGSIGKDYKIFKKKHKAYGKGLAMGLCNYLGVEFAG